MHGGLLLQGLHRLRRRGGEMAHKVCHGRAVGRPVVVPIALDQGGRVHAGEGLRHDFPEHAERPEHLVPGGERVHRGVGVHVGDGQQQAAGGGVPSNGAGRPSVRRPGVLGLLGRGLGGKGVLFGRHRSSICVKEKCRGRRGGQSWSKASGRVGLARAGPWG